MNSKPIRRAFALRCMECGFTSADDILIDNHSCTVEEMGGRCEDFPCCGHEFGDCNGLLYGSDEAIKADAFNHIDCDHEIGIFNCGKEDY